MFTSCASAVAGFCNSSGLNPFSVAPIHPAPPTASIATGSAGSSQRAWRRNTPRPSTITTPETANPVMAMEITQ